MKNYKAKPCRVCNTPFTPTSGKQWRCADCALKGSRPEDPPSCACGCGEPVAWSRALKGWRSFRHGHAVRVAETPPAKGHIAWTARVERQSEVREKLGGERHWRNRPENRKRARKYAKEQSEAFLGDRNPNWKGGVSYDWRSPKSVRTPDGTRWEHRLIMEKIVGRKLFARETVHHLDGDNQNNAPDNLHLFHCQGCHSYYHTTGADLRYVYAHLHAS